MVDQSRQLDPLQPSNDILTMIVDAIKEQRNKLSSKFRNVIFKKDGIEKSNALKDLEIKINDYQGKTVTSDTLIAEIDAWYEINKAVISRQRNIFSQNSESETNTQLFINHLKEMIRTLPATALMITSEQDDAVYETLIQPAAAPQYPAQKTHNIYGGLPVFNSDDSVSNNKNSSHSADYAETGLPIASAGTTQSASQVSEAHSPDLTQKQSASYGDLQVFNSDDSVSSNKDSSHAADYAETALPIASADNTQSASQASEIKAAAAHSAQRTNADYGGFDSSHAAGYAGLPKLSDDNTQPASQAYEINTAEPSPAPKIPASQRDLLQGSAPYQPTGGIMPPTPSTGGVSVADGHYSEFGVVRRQINTYNPEIAKIDLKIKELEASKSYFNGKTTDLKIQALNQLKAKIQEKNGDIVEAINSWSSDGNGNYSDAYKSITSHRNIFSSVFSFFKPLQTSTAQFVNQLREQAPSYNEQDAASLSGSESGQQAMPHSDQYPPVGEFLAKAGIPLDHQSESDSASLRATQ